MGSMARGRAAVWTGLAAGWLLVATVVDAQDSTNSEAGGAKAWLQIQLVLKHPRCLNCHQANTPLQGDDRHTHIPLVVRGADNHGVGAMRCGNCHNGSGNNESSGTPGGGGEGMWQLAPLSMLWQGLSSGELCRTLKDPAHNGGRDGAALIHHMEDEPLVLWGWHPGGDRSPVPISHADFVERMEQWVAAGMPCPA
jgi:hypothetical protein